MGFQVYVMDSSNNFDDICRVFIGLGRFLKLEQKAEDIVNQSKLRVEQVKKRVEKLSKPSVFWEVGAQPMFTVSKKSFVNDFIVFAGGQNIFSELPSRYPQISREEVVLRDPDYIIMVTMGDLGSHELASWAKFKTLKAVKYSRVMCLQESIFTIPTPDAIAAGIEKISGILHPK
jgi:iron complex transport system substrate-binding protein